LMFQPCLICVICFCLRIVVSNTYCVVFFFVLCTVCCQFLWIVPFWLPLRYSLTFIYLLPSLCACLSHFISLSLYSRSLSKGFVHTNPSIVCWPPSYLKTGA
jgi:hypothetical protein